jgi:hypothetical protein
MTDRVHKSLPVVFRVASIKGRAHRWREIADARIGVIECKVFICAACHKSREKPEKSESDGLHPEEIKRTGEGEEKRRGWE